MELVKHQLSLYGYLQRASQSLFNLSLQMSGNSTLEIFLKIRRLWWSCCPLWCLLRIPFFTACWNKHMHRHRQPDKFHPFCLLAFTAHCILLTSQEPSLPLLLALLYTVSSTSVWSPKGISQLCHLTAIQAGILPKHCGFFLPERKTDLQVTLIKEPKSCIARRQYSSIINSCHLKLVAIPSPFFVLNHLQQLC